MLRQARPPEGDITKYEWDVDGDGTFEVDTELTPTLDVQFTENGIHNPAVRGEQQRGPQ